MKLVVTQPNYLPWLGYFAQLNACDHLVVLDDVQFARREWQNRNKIVNRDGKVSFVTLPIRKAPRSTNINEIRVSEDFKFDQHLDKFASYYRFDRHNDPRSLLLSSILDNSILDSSPTLSVLNTSIFQKISSLAGINFSLSFSSQLFSTNDDIEKQTPTERILSICQKLGADVYLSSPGAKHYMDKELFKFYDSSIQVLWQKFTHKPYARGLGNQPFVPYLSIVDYICNSDLSSLKIYLAACHDESF